MDIYPTIKIYSIADITDVASGAMSACRERPVYPERCNSTGKMRDSPALISCELWDHKKPMFA